MANTGFWHGIRVLQGGNWASRRPSPLHDLMIPACNGTSLDKLHRKKVRGIRKYRECSELSQLELQLTESLTINRGQIQVTANITENRALTPLSEGRINPGHKG